MAILGIIWENLTIYLIEKELELRVLVADFQALYET